MPLIENANDILKSIQDLLKLDGGSFHEELPEQLMIVSYLKGNEKVLELGSHIGRSSLIIASILNKNNNNNFLTIEPNFKIFSKLENNKRINNLNFYCENIAISEKPLIQKDFDKFTFYDLLAETTWQSEFLPNGYVWVKTMTMSQIKEKYKIDFDTLVIDCEGAFYPLLKDNQDILSGINLIIMENDYLNLKSKNNLDKILLDNNFYLEYNESGGFGPCEKVFYQVWKRDNNGNL